MKKRQRARVYLFDEKNRKEAVIFCPRINECKKNLKCRLAKKYEEMGYRITCLNPEYYSEYLLKKKGLKYLDEEVMRDGL